MQPPASNRKISLSMAALVACILGIGVGLLSLNYYHASRCTGSQSTDEMETFIASIEKRLLQAESKNIQNAIIMDKVLRVLQSRLVKIEANEMEKIMQSSQDQAVKIALELAKEPPPPRPDFELDTKYNDAESLADIIDDILGSTEESLSYSESELDGYGSSYSKDSSSSSSSYKKIPAVSDAEEKVSCLDWKSKYEVITGVSWGKLPYDLQQKWFAYHCDQHVSAAV